MSKNMKKNPSNRVTSGVVKNELTAVNAQPQASSLVGSVASADSKNKPRSYPLWPEFLENELNVEKWDGIASKGGKDKGKSPSLQFFDDLEGRIEMPPSIQVDSWRRPQDFLDGKIPVVVENDIFDLVKPNEHLYHSEVMRTIIGQIVALWNLSQSDASPLQSPSPESGEDIAWKPWEHIYSLCKAGKGHVPMYNPFGKYIVRLYWMGCWRKIIVDDLMPFDVDGKILLPTTTLDHELWPMLLCKALVKLAAIDYNLSSSTNEFGNFYVVQALMGWIPEVIPVQQNYKTKAWQMLKHILPEWKLPTEETKTRENSSSSASSKKDFDMETPENVPPRPEKGSGKEVKAPKEGQKKKDDKEKQKSSPTARPQSDHHSADGESTTEPLQPESVVFAMFNQKTSTNGSFSVLRRTANASENLRKIGLSQLHPHPVMITQTRSCPLVAPPPEPVIPRWKLIRPFKKPAVPSDEPQLEMEPPKPDQWLEISSPYLGFRMDPLRKLEATSRPQSYVSAGEPLSEVIESAAVPTIEVEPEPESVESPLDRTDSVDEDRDMNRPIASARNSNKGGTKGTPVAERPSSATKKEKQQDPAPTVTNPVQKKSWVDFSDFCQSFSNILIFHKPYTYPHTANAGEFRQSVLTAGSGNKKGSAQLVQAPSLSNLTKPGSITPVLPKSYEGFPLEDRTPSFLFVDNVEASEVIVGLSVLARWPGLEEKRSSDRESLTGSSEAITVKQDHQTQNYGLLVAETYSWKTLVTGQPVLRIRTSGSKAACLILPPGRHVLRFIFNFPLGYHVSICSSTPFVYGDEETVMVSLQQESCRFAATAEKIFSSLGKSIEHVGDHKEWSKSREQLHKALLPYEVENPNELTGHYKAWNEALYKLLESVIPENKKTDALGFAVKSLTMDCNPDSMVKTHVAHESPSTMDAWKDRTWSSEEEAAAECIQRNWRGTHARKLYRVHRDHDSSEHLAVREALNAAWTAMQADAKTHSLSLLRCMLKLRPALMNKYPFHKDEWNKLCYTDYNGTFADQPPKTWFVAFRDVFYVQEDVLCVPKLYLHLPTCMLRVIDNDTGREIQRVFQKVAPHVYKKNHRGYTLVAEARTLDQPLPGGKWKLKMIGATNSLPSPRSPTINWQFSNKDIKDYYLPNDQNILFRYVVKCSADHIASLQLETSKEDVHVTLQILDNEVEIISAKGKGHCVIPAFCFLTNNKQPERPNSHLSNQESHQALTQSSKQSLNTSPGKKRIHSGKSREDKSEQKSGLEVESLSSVEEGLGQHHYIIQARIGHKSWPLTAVQWSHVQKLQQLEKEDLKAFSGYRERTASLSGKGSEKQHSGGKNAAGAEKGKKGGKGGDKGGREKKGQDKDAGSRPASQNTFDGSRAFWSLRVVSDQDHADDIDIRKDIRRQEEIRAMKQAWEAAEPGRAVKAMQARLSYSSKNAPATDEKVADDSKSEISDQAVQIESEEKEVLLLHPLHPVHIPEVNQNDIDRYLRPVATTANPRYYNSEALERLEEQEMRESTESYNEQRTKAVAFREQNKQNRILLKDSQMESCNEMQAMYDKARTDLLKAHFNYRNSLLEAKKQKEEAAAAAATPEQISPEPKAKSAGKKKK